MLKKNIFLIGIVLIAFILRFWQLGINPPSLNWDEAAWGYNAYSLGIDGKDEFGQFLPYKYLESYGDFKPPVYAYLDILPVKLFGLNEFTTRLPSAFFGSLTVLLTYFLVLEVFCVYSSKRKESKSLTSEKFIYSTAILSAFILAVSPWHINLSRAAFEANVASFFLILGVYLFLVGIRLKHWILPFSVVSLALTLYIFNTSRIVAPLLGIVLVAAFYKELLSMWKEAIVAAFCGLLLVIPITGFLLSHQASLRFQEVNIFSDISVIKQTNQEIVNDQDAAISKIIHNRRIAYGVLYMKHYFDNFSPWFLFIKGDQNARFSTQEVGEMYILDLPLLLIGIYILFKTRQGHWWLIPIWLLVGIVPAATARETPHALRIETTLPTLHIVAAIGAASVIMWLLSIKKYTSLLIGIVAIGYIFCTFYYLQEYYRYYPKDSSSDWQYGYKEAVLYARSVQNKYKEIDVTTGLGRPYIYFLFYGPVAPQEFRKTANITRDTFGFVHVNGFDKYKFLDILDPHPKKGVLYFQVPDLIPANAHIVDEFKLLNGTTVLKAYTI